MLQAKPGISAFACLAILFIAAAFVFLPDAALASSTSSGGSLPWESPLKTVSDSLTGPVAYAVSLIGVVVTGAMLIFGGEINEFARRIIMLVLVIALLVSATNIMSSLFNSGAIV
jgi:type IV secretion system protein VirB2